MPDIQPHDRFSSTLTLTEEDIATFAKASGDLNPLHHDREFAEASRYGGIIASGPQTSSLLMGATASHFSTYDSMVGLKFEFSFRAPVRANDPLQLEWLIVAVRNAPKMGGRIVDLRGRLVTSNGKTAVGAKGLVLVGV